MLEASKDFVARMTIFDAMSVTGKILQLLIAELELYGRKYQIVLILGGEEDEASG